MSIMQGPVYEPFPEPPINPIGFLFGAVKELFERGKRAIEAFFSSNDDIGEQKPLNEKKSTADDMIQIQNILTDYRADAKSAGAEVLGTIKDECRQFFEKTVSHFEGCSKSFGMDFLPGTIKKRFDRSIEEIDEVFEGYLSKRFSLDDSECTAILKMMPGESKSQKMAEFKKNVFSNAIDKVCNCIEKYVEDFFDTLEDSFIHKIDLAVSDLRDKTEAFKLFSEESKESEYAVEDRKLVSSYRLAFSELVLTVIDGGEC